MPILFGSTSKSWLYGIATAMLAGLATTGLTSGSGLAYFAGTGITMARIFYLVCLLSFVCIPQQYILPASATSKTGDY